MDYKVLLEKVIPPLLAAILGAMGGTASRKVTDADESATVQENRQRVLALDEKVESIRSGFRQYADILTKEEEEAREKESRELRERIVKLETQLEELRRNR